MLRLRFRPWLPPGSTFDIENAVIPSIRYGRISRIESIA
jgi:hypothetical protein